MLAKTGMSQTVTWADDTTFIENSLAYLYMTEDYVVSIPAATFTPTPLDPAAYTHRLIFKQEK